MNLLTSFSIQEMRRDNCTCGTVRLSHSRGQGGLLRDAPEEIPRPMTYFDNVLSYLEVQRVDQLVLC